MEDKKRRSTRRSAKSGSSGSKPKGEKSTPRSSKRTTKTEGAKSAGSAKSASSTVQVEIAVDDAHLDDFARIVERGRELGLEVEQELPEVGVLIGRIPADKVDELSEVEGVDAVERPRSYRIAPPESDVQ